MERLHLLLVIGLFHVWPIAASAQAVLPQSLESCEDVDVIVEHYLQWEVQDAEPASDGGWNQAVIRANRSPGSRAIAVRESDIELFAKCWERDFRERDYRYTDYQLRMSTVVNDLFPLTDRVALELVGLAGRVEGIAGEALSALDLLAVTPSAMDELEAERQRIGERVTPLLRDQWWQCWEAASQESVDSATYACRGYSGAIARWLFGFMSGDDDIEQMNQAVARLRAILEGGASPKERQIAVLAAFDRQTFWDQTTELGLRALKDPDPGVRLMAVRLADEARIDTDGKPADAEFRRALENIARRDPDARIRKEANKILQLPPYGGPG